MNSVASGASAAKGDNGGGAFGGEQYTHKRICLKARKSLERLAISVKLWEHVVDQPVVVTNALAAIAVGRPEDFHASAMEPQVALQSNVGLQVWELVQVVRTMDSGGVDAAASAASAVDGVIHKGRFDEKTFTYGSIKESASASDERLVVPVNCWEVVAHQPEVLASALAAIAVGKWDEFRAINDEDAGNIIQLMLEPVGAGLYLLEAEETGCGGA